MTRFTLNETIYTSNNTGSHCYKQPKNQAMTRIKKDEFEQAHNEFVQGAIREAEESVATEEALEVAHEAQVEEKPKKNPRKRTPKDIGYRNTFGDIEVILTAKQADFINHLPDTCYWENGLDSAIWVDCLCDEIGGQFEGKPMTVGAMISTLCEKGIGVRGKDKVNGKKCTSFALTELGKLVAKDLGL